jgi:hypothetical protein
MKKPELLFLGGGPFLSLKMRRERVFHVTLGRGDKGLESG